ncbi:hypothetical protein OsJ_04604 [Oryza sativa Japonica Group]|uniref:CID domain-containing protein n=1 Tax=Oryza sativa subsp. japonica TaxID=39947 RepID=B9EVZ0_ORYSJ|nr:hypothetical protein OsJ_04604 [Oryza sativa Japonica Group]
MNAGFSPQILAQKLLKLNNSRQSIETLSHWCVFHYRHCRQVVETWESDFHSAPRERRVSLLYLANDIVQNSKKDSGRYVNEFWRVIPAALNDVFVNGDDFGRNVVQRLPVVRGHARVENKAKLLRGKQPRRHVGLVDE